jgi:hypothetical protein
VSYDREQLQAVIRRVTGGLGLGGFDAERLLLGTVAKESGFGRYLRQLGGGPALGAAQVEPATMRDIYTNHLAYRPERAAAVALVSGVSEPSVWQLEINLAFNLAMARLKYRMIPAPLPDGRDVWAMARYWHRWYCANGYPGQVEQFVADWFRFCA